MFSLRFFLMAIVLQVFVLTVTYSLAAAEAPGLDRASNECLSCHTAEGPESFHKGEGQTVHIVGKDYALSRASDPTLAPVETLDPLLKLVEGKVSCITCHTVYSEGAHPKEGESTGDKMLTVTNEGSALCLACHLK